MSEKREIMVDDVYVCYAKYRRVVAIYRRFTIYSSGSNHNHICRTESFRRWIERKGARRYRRVRPTTLIGRIYERAIRQTTEQKQEQWAIVDLFGHTRVAGRISEQTIGGGTFLRVDVPAVDGRPASTSLYGNNAIYGIRFVTEEVARAAARAFRVEPITPYDLPALRQRQLGLHAERDDEPSYDD